MEWPYYKQGYVYWPFGLLEINSCDFNDFQQLFPNVPQTHYPVEAEIIMFYFDVLLGEIKAFFDVENNTLLELDLELFEDVDLGLFLTEMRKEGCCSYNYFEYKGATYMVFNKNFLARLNLSNDKHKVACLVFMNRHYIDSNEILMAQKIRQAAASATHLI